jgi:hypothetical protein
MTAATATIMFRIDFSPGFTSAASRLQAAEIMLRAHYSSVTKGRFRVTKPR